MSGSNQMLTLYHPNDVDDCCKKYVFTFTVWFGFLAASTAVWVHNMCTYVLERIIYTIYSFIVKTTLEYTII